MRLEQVKISNVKPPVAEECERRFGVDWDKGFAVAYKDTIFIRPGITLTNDFIVHEATHIEQQMKHPGKEEGWWKAYFTDEDFRLDQELIAYRRQYERYCMMWKDRNKQTKMLHYFMDCLRNNYRFKSFDSSESLRIISGK